MKSIALLLLTVLSGVAGPLLVERRITLEWDSCPGNLFYVFSATTPSGYEQKYLVEGTNTISFVIYAHGTYKFKVAQVAWCSIDLFERMEREAEWQCPEEWNYTDDLVVPGESDYGNEVTFNADWIVI